MAGAGWWARHQLAIGRAGLLLALVAVAVNVLAEVWLGTFMALVAVGSSLATMRLAVRIDLRERP